MIRFLFLFWIISQAIKLHSNQGNENANATDNKSCDNIISIISPSCFLCTVIIELLDAHFKIGYAFGSGENNKLLATTKGTVLSWIEMKKNLL